MQRVKILRASAGSGKTYRLAYEYIKNIIVKPQSYSSILAVTFTNKATEEMKSRIVAELNALSKGDSPYMAELLASTMLSREHIIRNATTARSLILHDYSHFSISTIDKFFQKIIRGFVKELGLDFGYTVELNGDSYLTEAVDRLIDRSGSDEELNSLLHRVLSDNIENAKSWDVRADLIKIGKQVMKENYRPLDADIDLLINQYNQLQERVGERRESLRTECEAIMELMAYNNLTPADFKGGSRSFAYIFIKLANGNVVDNIHRLEKVISDADEWYSKSSKRKNDIASILPELMDRTGAIIHRYEQFETIKNSYDLLSANFNRTLLLEHISEELNKLWAERNKLPIHQTTRLISTLVENTAVPFIYEKAGNRFESYMIDEFQDTSIGQWRNFLPLLDEAVSRSDEQSVMLIGDVKQAIYRWRGGDWSILAYGATDHWAEDADTSEQLNTNWRSLPVVVDFNNALIRTIVDNADNKFLRNVYEDFEQNTPQHKTGGYVAISPIEPEELEQYVVEQLQSALERGYRQSDVAMLVRNKRHGRQISDILLRNGFNIIDQESLLLSNSQAVIMIVSVLKMALKPGEPLSLAQFNRWAGKELNTPFEDNELLELLHLQTPIEAINTIINHYKLGEDSRNVTYLQAFYEEVTDFTNETSADLTYFSEWWDEVGCKKNLYLPSSQDAVTIVTIHKSKGLQYPVVFIPFCQWELEPTHYKPQTIWASTEDADFEIFNPAPVIYSKAMERSVYFNDFLYEKCNSLIDAVNMLYVAVTRAERELYVAYDVATRKNDISSLITEALGEQKIFGRKDFYDNNKKLREITKITFESFNITNPYTKVRTSWDSQRYYEDGGVIETPVSQGVLMHKLFSRIVMAEDVDGVLELMVISGEFSHERAGQIKKLVDKALTNSIVASWFEPHWRLYTENAMILPGMNHIKRPDRVITDGRRAVVVDYKFGKVVKKSYITQIEEYKTLLSQMGYETVEGYIWYVDSGDVVPV